MGMGAVGLEPTGRSLFYYDQKRKALKQKFNVNQLIDIIKKSYDVEDHFSECNRSTNFFEELIKKDFQLLLKAGEIYRSYKAKNIDQITPLR